MQGKKHLRNIMGIPASAVKVIAASIVLSLLFGWGGAATSAQSGGEDFGPLGAGESRAGAPAPENLTAPEKLEAIETDGVLSPGPAATLASAQAGESWQNYPLYGGEMTSILVDPFNAQTVYVGTRDGGVFKTTDGAVNWVPARSGLTYYPIRSLAADTAHAGMLYAGTDKNGVWKTTDGGAHWAFSGSGIDEDLIVFNIVIDPTNSSTLYAGTAGGVGLVVGHIYKSTNGGASWQQKDSGMPLEAYSTFTNGVVALAIDPSNPSILYAGTTYAGAFRSTNGGESWSAINTGLEMMSGDSYHTVSALVIDPWHSNRAAALYGGEYYAFASNTWSKVNEEGQRPGTGIHAERLYFHPTSANTIFAAGSTFKVSTNGGLTWEQRLGWPTSSGIMAVGFHASTPNTIYAAADILFQYEGGVWKTTNQGSSWTNVSKGITAPEVYSVAVDPTNAQKIYVGTGEPSSGYFYRSTDGGQTWSRGAYEMIGGSLDNTFGEISDLAVDPNNPQKIFLAGTSFYMSTNEGQLFTEVEEVAYPGSIAMPAGAPNTVYVGSGFPGNGIYKSTNGGASFEQKNTGVPLFGEMLCPIQALAPDPSNPNVLWAGTGSRGGILKTTDGGEHWVAKGLAENNRVDAIAISPQNSNTILAGAGDFEGKIYKTRDGGNTWKIVLQDVGMVMDLLYDPRDANWVYAFTQLSGVLRSSDGGEHWFPYHNGIFYPMMYQGAFTPGSSPRLISGSFGSGLYWITPDISEPLVKSVYLPVILH